MSNLSYTKEFFMLAVNKKGKVPYLSTTKVWYSLFAGSMAELYFKGMISKNENDEFVSNNTFDDNNMHLLPLYEVIKAADKPMTMQEIVHSYFKSCCGKKPAQLEASIKDMLVSKNAKVEIKTGFLKNKIGVAPKPEKVQGIINKIHAQFFGADSLSADTFCLVDLLCKSKLAGQHFSEDDTARLKTRLEELSASGTYATEKQLLDCAFKMSEKLVEGTPEDEEEDMLACFMLLFL